MSANVVEDQAIDIAARYIRDELRRPDNVFRLSYGGVDKLTKQQVVYATHPDDMVAPPGQAIGRGCGESLILLIDPERGTVDHSFTGQ